MNATELKSKLLAIASSNPGAIFIAESGYDKKETIEPNFEAKSATRLVQPQGRAPFTVNEIDVDGLKVPVRRGHENQTKFEIALFVGNGKNPRVASGKPRVFAE